MSVGRNDAYRRRVQRLYRGSLVDAVLEVLRAEFGWSGESSLSLGDLELVVGTRPSPDLILLSVEAEDERCRLLVPTSEGDVELTFRRGDDARAFLAALESLSQGQLSREALVDRTSKAIGDLIDQIAAESTFHAMPTGSTAGHEQRVEAAIAFVSRVVVVRFIESAGWLKWPGGGPYLAKFAERWHEDETGYTLAQRFSQLAYLALDQTDPKRRRALTQLLGDLKPIGGGLSDSAALMDERATRFGVVVIESAGVERLMSAEGPLYSAEFALIPPDRRPTPYAILPSDWPSVLGVPAPESTADTWETLARSLEMDPSSVRPEAIARLPDGSKRSVLRRLTETRWVDMDARDGSALVRLLHALQAIRLAAGGEPTEAGRFARNLLRDQIGGYGQDERFLRLGRWNLALAALSYGGPECGPLPNLAKALRAGEAMQHATETLPREVESERLEFKSSIELSTHTGKPDRRLRERALRTVVGFLNADGGEVWFGMADDGTPVGIEAEVALMRDLRSEDVFVARLHERISRSIEPAPVSLIRASVETVGGRRVLRVRVSASDRLHRLVHEDGTRVAWVRDGNRTRKLRDDEVASHRAV